jgi:hypothetical protein
MDGILFCSRTSKVASNPNFQESANVPSISQIKAAGCSVEPSLPEAVMENAATGREGVGNDGRNPSTRVRNKAKNRTNDDEWESPTNTLGSVRLAVFMLDPN